MVETERGVAGWFAGRLPDGWFEGAPQVEVDADVLFVDAGQVLTSAGAASGIDLCLHLVRRDHGVALANQVARRLVSAPYRSGGQAQYVPRSIPEPLGDDFARTRAAGFPAVVHAGEAAGPASVRGALDHLHAARIGHGVRAMEDPTLIGRLADTPSVNPTSTGRDVIKYAIGVSTGSKDENGNRGVSWFRVASFSEGAQKDLLLSLPKG